MEVSFSAEFLLNTLLLWHVKVHGLATLHVYFFDRMTKNCSISMKDMSENQDCRICIDQTEKTYTVY